MKKDKETMLMVKAILEIPADEPIFIIRARDKFSIDSIMQYKHIVLDKSIIGETSNEWVAQIGSIINDFINWQRDNRNKVKVPD